jgi:hypothetical protein
MVSPEDFMPEWGSDVVGEKQQSVDEQKQILQSIALIFGGKDNG